MSKGRLDSALLLAFGDRDEVPIHEIRAALFLEYSEAELLRRGINNASQNRRLASLYIAGEQITNQERAKLLQHGIDYMMRVNVAIKKWLYIDKQQGVVRRVRSEMA